jgi:hypothetical protein
MTRITVCIALCATLGCGSSSSENKTPSTPITPAPVAPTAPMLAGTWTGMFDVTSCTGSAEWCQGTEPEPFLLNLDGNLYGVAEMEIWHRQPMSLDILQSNDVDGSTTLRGVSTVTGQPRLDLEIRLEGSAPSSLNGSVRYTVTGDPSRELTKSLSATRSGPILFIRPVTIVRAGALQGTWRGYVKRTACSGDCDSGRTSPATFWFSQQGARLTGIFSWSYAGAAHVEIEGTASGQEFTFTRAVTRPTCFAGYQSQALCEESFDMRGSVDSLGRMKGTIQQRQVGNDYYDGPFSWTATFELEGVVRQKGIQ